MEKKPNKGSNATALEISFGPIEERLTGLLKRGKTRLLESEIYEILNIAGLETPSFLHIYEEKDLRNIDLSAIKSDEVVCKVLSPDLPHRFEIGGVRFLDKNPDDLAEVFSDFKKLAEERGVSFQGMLIAERIECRDTIPYQLLLSFRQDGAFGPVLFLGLGGVGTELYKEAMKNGRALFVDHASSMENIDKLEKRLEQTFFYPVLTGRTRMLPETILDGQKLFKLLGLISRLAQHFSPLNPSVGVTIEELEINPLQVTDSGSLIPLDGIMKISRKKFTPSPPPTHTIQTLLKPSSALIIGASATKMNVGRIILNNLLKEGGIDKEKIILLHPKAESIDGCTAVKSIDEISDPVDMAVFTIPADEKSFELLEGLIRGRKAKTITLISAGFGETEKGKELEERLKLIISEERAGDDGGVAVNGPNCMGIVSRAGGYNTFFLPEYKLPFKSRFGGNCAVISQSGAYIVTLTSNLNRILNPKYMITYGNQIDVSVTDYLIAIKDDPDIDLFCLYLEGLKPFDGYRFIKVAGEIIGMGKAILLYKAGRTEAGAKAVASHTASMAGDFEVMKNILSSTGIIIADTLDEFEDLVKVFSLLFCRNCKGRRVGIYSNAGFECSVAADNLEKLELATFADTTIEKLHRYLPTGIIDIHNPIDATPQTNSINYGKCLEAILEDPNIDCLLAANVAPTPFMENLPASSEHNENILNENSYPNITIRVFRNTTKPMVVSLNSGELYDPAARMMEDAGIPVFRKIDRALRTLEIFVADRTSD